MQARRGFRGLGRTAAKTATPPPLRALGGWLGADWFCPTVLSDAEVVGFTLPKLAGSRKQTFRLVERSRSSVAASGVRAGPAARSPKHKQVSLADILDEFGATRAAAFRRTTFLFESAPVLYFAEIPLANVKLRSADNLRRALIDSGLRGCVLLVEAKTVIAMFWPAAEHEITMFVSQAEPPYALHAQFDQPQAAVRVRQPRRPANKGQESQEGHTPLGPGERELLLRELAELRSRVAELQQSQSALSAMEALGLDDARLKAMLRLLHPDRHGGSEAANDAAKWVNNLRDLLKTARA